MLYDLNSNLNNIVKISFIRILLVDCLMCLNISLIALKILKSSLSGSIYKQVLVLMLFVFSFRRQYFCHCVHFPQFLLRAYNHVNISQFYNLKHYILFAYFLIQMNSLFLLGLIVLLFKMTSYCLNPNLNLNLCADVVLQSIITLTANSSSIKILLHSFSVRLLFHIYVFYDLNYILL